MKNELLIADQLRKLYDHSIFGVLATILNGSILAFVLWGQVGSTSLTVWLACMLLVSIVRLSVTVGYRRAAPSSPDDQKWKYLFFYSIFLAGILWGAPSIFLFPATSIGHQAFIAFVTGGMVVGAVASFTSILTAYYLFSVPALLPLIIRFFMVGSEIHMAMAFMTLLFFLIMSFTALRTHREYVRLLALRYENRNLVEELQQEVSQRQRAEQDLVQKNQQIEAIVAARTDELKEAIQQLHEDREALRKGEEKYRDLVENISDVLFATDRSGRIEYISPVVEAVFGYEPEEILHKQFCDLADPDERLRMRSDLDQVLDRASKVCEYRFLSKSGQRRWCRTSIRPVLENNRVSGVQGILADITQSKFMEEQLQRAHKMEALGTLAGGVAHDLNNILSGIVSYPDLLLLDLPEDSPLRAPLTTIRSSGRKAATIVQDLLTLARRGVASAELMNLNSIVEEHLLSPEFKTLLSFFGEVRIKKNLRPDLMNLIGSKVHIAKSLMNLVSNAAEAMPSGGTITISTANLCTDTPVTGFDTIIEGEYVVLTVTDTGVGIAEEDLARIFEPFYTRKIMGRSGSGLGMAVVWGTVKDHGGHINVTSRPGVGTSFELYFPATRQALPESSSPIPYEAYLGHGEPILVVDDSQQQREIAVDMIRRLGYRPEAVAGGEQAIDYLAECKPALILLDMIMEPGIDGYETFKRIVALNPRQKAIIVSGYSETEQVRKTLALGAGQYLRKPYDLETIGLAISRELARKPESEDV